MTLEQICQEIKNRRKNGQSYQKIADELHLTKPTVRRIEQGSKVSKETAQLLNLEPSADLQYTRRRNETLDIIAKERGYKSWSEFETWEIKNYLFRQNHPQP